MTNAPQTPPGPLLVFDPRTDTFDWFVHPQGRRMELLATTGGRLWLHTRDGRRSWLESFDGHTFTTHYDAGTRWYGAPPRGLLVASDGDVFVLPEQTGVGWLHADGRYESFTSGSAFPARARSAASRSRRAAIGSAIATASSSSPEHRTGPDWRVVRSAMQTVRSLGRARDGTIWAGAGSGLHAYRNGSWVTMTAVEGLA